MKRKWKQKRLAAAAAMVIVVFSAIPAVPAMAAGSYETQVPSEIQLGAVDIMLTETETDESRKEIGATHGRLVTPGATVEDIVRITNRANDVWTRVKIGYHTEGGELTFTDDMISPDSSDWIQRGEYWYCTHVLEKGEAEEFIREIKIPATWSSKDAGKDFKINIRADAVQAANFTPDFQSDDPWFGTVIEAFTKKDTVWQTNQSQAFSISFEGGAEGLVKTGDNFFSNWGHLMPGDTVSDTVKLANHYAKQVSLYFRTENASEDALLKQLQICIKNGDDVIFDGKLADTMKEELLLAKLNNGDEMQLSYTVSVPKELNNIYALENAKTTWIFRAQLNSSGGSGGHSGGHKGGSGSGNGNGPGTEKKNPELPTKDSSQSGAVSPDNPIDKAIDTIKKYVPKMGDDNVETTALCIMGMSGFLLLALWSDKKKKKIEKN